MQEYVVHPAVGTTAGYSRVHARQAGEVDLVEHHDPALDVVLAQLPDVVVGRSAQVGRAWRL